MPKFSKNVLSQRLRTQCDRQLRLNLYTDSEREKRGMPEESKTRGNIYRLQEAGDRWQAKVFKDLSEAFGNESIVGNQKEKSERDYEHEYNKVPLEDLIGTASPGRYIVEGKYEITDPFAEAVGAEDIEEPETGEPLTFSAVVPDIIEVVASRKKSDRDLGGEVRPSGEIVPLSGEDDRLRLRVIDVKLTSEPSPSYFAEVAYYSMTLASWLKAAGLTERFVVVEDAAIWPGAHPGSHLRKRLKAWRDDGYADPDDETIRAVMREDLEEIPFDVFAPRVRRLIGEEVPSLLKEDWRDHDWHVGLHCQGCDFLGIVWGDKEEENLLHCAPMADEEDDLSQVAEISRGSSDMLRANGVDDLNDLAAQEPRNPVFEKHQELRARRTVMPSRATSLVESKKKPPLPEKLKLVPRSGTSAVMPRWPDLKVFLFAEFDLSSAISFSFGYKAFWFEPFLDDEDAGDENAGGAEDGGEDEDTDRKKENWGPKVFLVHKRDIEEEREVFLSFLKRLRLILEHVEGEDETASNEGRRTGYHTKKSSVQFFLWDTAQKQHLMRVVGRHLDAILADEDLGDLAWLFPSDEIVPDWRDAKRSSPLTVVSDVVHSHLALPIPHVYTLMEVVDSYNDMDEQKYVPHIKDFFSDPLSSLIPSERGHDMWSHDTPGESFPGWMQVAQDMKETGRKKLRALESVTQRLRKDLEDTLSYKAAPNIGIGPPKRLPAASWDAQLWRAFSRLNSALDKLEMQQIRALPTHEREARFKSARLRRRLSGPEKEEALRKINEKQNKSLDKNRTGRYVYRMREGSEDVSFREGDFTVAISSEINPDHSGLVEEPISKVMDTDALKKKYEGEIFGWPFETMAEPLRVEVEAIDRENRVVVIRSTRYPEVLKDLEEEGVTDLSEHAILDPTSVDFFNSKLEKALRAIGDPDVAGDDPNVRRAVGQQDTTSRTSSDHTPAAGFLWEPRERHEERKSADPEAALATLSEQGDRLNDSQKEAFSSALTRNLTLIWGPPGTGKSRTLRAIVKGAALDAAEEQKPLRVLVTAFTYRALDEVLLKVAGELSDLPIGDEYEIVRVRPKHQSVEDAVTASSARDVDLDKRSPSQKVLQLRRRLKEKEGITVVGVTPEQTFNFMQAGGRAQEELFDFAVLDEASQMDVAHAVLPLCAMAEGAGLVVAGDDKQLDPIHRAEPPEGLEHMVGSIYNFFSKHHGVPHTALRTNYRSSEEIVRFVRKAGYDQSLRARSPDLKLRLLEDLPDSKPAGWPRHLNWHPEWKTLLDPEKPVGCFTYEDEMSGQSNSFEADSVAALLFLLYGRTADEPENLRGETGTVRAKSTTPYDPEGFWQKGVGVVTPHKAQMGRIITSLREAFPDTSPDLLRGAVDTVERFQGQQRDIIIGSFGLGDPDAIRDEDEFLYSLNRFNVMASRARAKLLVFVTRSVVDHLSSELETLRESRLLKAFADAYCNEEIRMTLSYSTEAGGPKTRPGVFRHRKR